MAWVEDFSDSTVKFIGTAELLGAIGLVLPPLLDIAPWLASPR
jgi:DoxX-like family